MRPIVLTAVLVLAPASISAQQRIERRIAVDAGSSIRIFNLNGTTRVTGWDRDSIAVTGSVPPAAGRFFMGGAGAAAKVGVFSDSAAPAGADLDIHVPRGATVWIKSFTANVEVSDVVGDIDISSVTGSIRVDGAPRRVTAEAMDGTIDLTTRAVYTRAKTASGAITIRGGGGDITASTVSGIIRYLGAHKVITGRLESVTGPVTFEGTVMRGGTLEVETHDGAIDLTVPPDQLADFDVTTFAGSVTNALNRESPVVPKGKPVRFSAGSGGARITVRTFKGNVRVGPG